MSGSVSNYQDWDGEILQRVSGVGGPIDILSSEQQEKIPCKVGNLCTWVLCALRLHSSFGMVTYMFNSVEYD